MTEKSILLEKQADILQLGSETNSRYFGLQSEVFTLIYILNLYFYYILCII